MKNNIIKLVIIGVFSLLVGPKVQALNSYCAYDITSELQSYTENLNILTLEDKNYSCYIFVDLTTKDWHGQDSVIGKKTCDGVDVDIYRPVRLYCSGITFNNDAPRNCESSNTDCIAYGTVIYDANNDGIYNVEDGEDSDYRTEIRINFKPNDSILNSTYVRNYSICPQIGIEQISNSNHLTIHYGDEYANMNGTKYTSLAEFTAAQSINFSNGLENNNVCIEEQQPGISATTNCEYVVNIIGRGKCSISATAAKNNFGKYYSKENIICDQDNLSATQKNSSVNIVDDIKMDYYGNLTGTCQSIYVQYNAEYESIYYDTQNFDGSTKVEPGQSIELVIPDNPSQNPSEFIPLPGAPNDKYDGLNTCSDIDVNKIKACGCIPAGIADITSKAYFILRIVGPILLLILGGFEMAKSIASQDESSIEKAKKKLVNKFIAAAAIFLILTIMELVVNLLAKNSAGILKCIHILLDGYVI